MKHTAFLVKEWTEKSTRNDLQHVARNSFNFPTNRFAASSGDLPAAWIDNGLFYANITIGTPPQGDFRMLVSTTAAES